MNVLYENFYECRPASRSFNLDSESFCWFLTGSRTRTRTRTEAWRRWKKNKTCFDSCTCRILRTQFHSLVKFVRPVTLEFTMKLQKFSSVSRLLDALLDFAPYKRSSSNLTIIYDKRPNQITRHLFIRNKFVWDFIHPFIVLARSKQKLLTWLLFMMCTLSINEFQRSGHTNSVPH